MDRRAGARGLPQATRSRSIRVQSVLVLLCLGVWGVSTSRADEGPLKIAFSFKDSKSDCQMALTRDSVGILELDPTAGALEPDDENGFEASILKRALSAGEKDTADMLMGLTERFKGKKRFVCSSKDGYAFSIWSDSLTLHCENCFSCTDGISMPEAKMLARFGKLTLWLYRIKGRMQPD